MDDQVNNHDGSSNIETLHAAITNPDNFTGPGFGTSIHAQQYIPVISPEGNSFQTTDNTTN